VRGDSASRVSGNDRRAAAVFAARPCAPAWRNKVPPVP